MKVSTEGKSSTGFDSPNVADDTVYAQGVDSDKLIRLLPVLFKGHDEDITHEVAGLVSRVPSKVEVDVAAGLAGLASAGEERVEPQSLLAMDTALLSSIVSLVELGFVLAGKKENEEGTKVGGGEKGTSSKPPFFSSTASLFSMDASSESDAGITDLSDHHAAFGPCMKMK